MKIWKFIESGPIPGTEDTLGLYQRDDEFEIRIDTRQLMNTRLHGSEDALADLAFDRLGEVDGARSLVGGLGMGFTLAAAVRRTDGAGQVCVAELVPSVVEWNRKYVGGAAGFPLSDPRTSVHLGDVSELIRAQEKPWHTILLDVDNGPASLTRSTNQWLYTHEGLDAAHDALVPCGILAVWSADPDPAFTRRFKRAGFSVEHVEVRARGKQGGRRHTIWIGQRIERQHYGRWYE